MMCCLGDLSYRIICLIVYLVNSGVKLQAINSLHLYGLHGIDSPFLVLFGESTCDDSLLFDLSSLCSSATPPT